jgi:chemotaxis protein histidine kinase CheA
VGKQEVVIKSLGSQFKKTKGFSGGAILGDGRIGLILDVKGIVEVYRETVECSDMNIDVMALSSHADAGEMHGDIG